MDTRVGLLVADSCAAMLAALDRRRGGEADELDELLFDELVAVGLDDPDLPLAVLLAPLAGVGALLGAIGAAGGRWHPAELGRLMVKAGAGISQVQLALELLPVAVLTVNGHHDALADTLDEYGFPFGCPVAECMAAAVALLAAVGSRVPAGIDPAPLVRRASGRVTCGADEVSASAIEQWFTVACGWEPVARSADGWAAGDPVAERRAALAGLVEVLVHSDAVPPAGSVCLVAVNDDGAGGHRVDTVLVDECAVDVSAGQLHAPDALALAVLRVSEGTVRCVVVDRFGGEAVAAAAHDGPAAWSVTLPGEAGHGHGGEPLLVVLHRALAAGSGGRPAVSRAPSS